LRSKAEDSQLHPDARYPRYLTFHDTQRDKYLRICRTGECTKHDLIETGLEKSSAISFFKIRFATPSTFACIYIHRRRQCSKTSMLRHRGRFGLLTWQGHFFKGDSRRILKIPLSLIRASQTKEMYDQWVMNLVANLNSLGCFGRLQRSNYSVIYLELQEMIPYTKSHLGMESPLENSYRQPGPKQDWLRPFKMKFNFMRMLL